jgi:hypothetical protein
MDEPRDARLRRIVGHGARRLATSPTSAAAALGRAALRALPESLQVAVARLRRRLPSASCAHLPRAVPGVDEPGRVSVVLPVHDHADLLGEALDGLLAQRDVDLEVVLIDDGSTDDVEPVLVRAARDPRVRVLRQPNAGLPTTLARGFALASGEFLTWTSADNVQEERHLAGLVAALCERSGVALVYGDHRVIDADGAPLVAGDFRPEARDRVDPSIVRLPRRAELLRSRIDNIVGPSFLYRGFLRRCLPHWHGPQGTEDYAYWLRLQSAFAIAHAGNDDAAYRYRWHTRTLSARGRELRILANAQATLRAELERSRAARPEVACYGKQQLGLALASPGRHAVVWGAELPSEGELAALTARPVGDVLHLAPRPEVTRALAAVVDEVVCIDSEHAPAFARAWFVARAGGAPVDPAVGWCEATTVFVVEDWPRVEPTADPDAAEALAMLVDGSPLRARSTDARLHLHGLPGRGVVLEVRAAADAEPALVQLAERPTPGQGIWLGTAPLSESWRLRRAAQWLLLGGPVQALAGLRVRAGRERS